MLASVSPVNMIAIADALRPSAKETVAKLRERGVQVAMLTGDNAGTAARIAGELGIDIVLADVLPGQKADKVKELLARYEALARQAIPPKAGPAAKGFRSPRVWGQAD